MPREWTVGNGSPAPCIRVVGNCSNITVKNCKFYHVAAAFDAGPRHGVEGGPANELLDNIRFIDNDIHHASRAETIAIHGGSQAKKGDPCGQLKHVEVLRNRVVDTGFRHGYCAWCSIPAIVVSWPETCEIAGNIVDTSFGNGIITYGGKGSGCCNVAPLTRMLVHHNQIDNTMLGCNDYGGLEHFQGGPVYLYSNLTRNAVGNRTLGSELGYNLYLDGGFKCYAFNNIIAGLVKPSQPDYYNHCGYFMVFGFMDQLFNNAIYHFKNDIGGNSGNRSNILGNLMLDCQESFIGQNRPGDVSMMGGHDSGETGRMGIPTMAYGSNVFYGNPKDFGCVAGISPTGSYNGAPVVPGKTLEELRDKLQAEKCRLATLGWQAADSPVVDPARKDYRLTATCRRHGLPAREVQCIDSIHISKLLFGKTRGIGHALDHVKTRLGLRDTSLRRHDARGDVDLLGRAVEEMSRRLDLDTSFNGVPRHATLLASSSMPGMRKTSTSQAQAAKVCGNIWQMKSGVYGNNCFSRY